MDTFDIVVRMSTADAHYGGNVVAGARVLELFGDAVTGLTALDVGDEGLIQSWEDIRFLKPVHPGDFLRVNAVVTKRMRLRRFITVTAHRFVRGLAAEGSAVEKVEPAECVADARGVIVVPYAAAKGA